MTLLWDVRSALEQDEARKLQEIIDTPKNAKKKSYYILKHSNWTGNGRDVLKSTYMLMSRKPPKMLGTVLWLVDNVKGTIDRIWELPLDIDYVGTHLQDGSGQEIVHDSAQGITPAIVLS